MNIDAATITVNVMCFAQLRDKLGADTFSLALSAGSTMREFLDALTQRNPSIMPLIAVSRLAVNCEYVPSNDVILQDGDEVAVIPPVSGG